MKISELTNKSFLGTAGAAANSYVLINYSESSTGTPVTYKATLQELGKAIVNDQQLYKKTVNGAVTTTVNNGAYANGTAEKLVTSSEAELLSKMTLRVRGGDSAPIITMAGADIDTATILTNKAYSDASANYGNIVVYDTATESLKYISDSNKLTAIEIESGGGDGGSQTPPTTISVEGDDYSYVLYDSSMRTFTVESGGEFISMPILTSNPIEYNAAYGYLFMNQNDKTLGVGSSIGIESSLGYLVVYDTTNGLGYIDSNGLFVAINQ